MAAKTNPWLVEAKVIATTVAMLLVGVAITVLNEVPGNASLMGSLPGWVQGVITLVGPPLVAFLTGYRAAHTSRPDLEVAASRSTGA